MTELREGRAFDVPACAAILNAWIDETPWLPRLGPAEEVEDFVRERLFAREVTVAEDGTTLAGFVALDRPVRMIDALYVAAGQRGRGLGAALLARATEGLPGVSLWTFQRNTAARAFYAAHGFREARTTQGDNMEGLPDVEFVR